MSGGRDSRFGDNLSQTTDFQEKRTGRSQGEGWRPQEGTSTEPRRKERVRCDAISLFLRQLY